MSTTKSPGQARAAVANASTVDSQTISHEEVTDVTLPKGAAAMFSKRTGNELARFMDDSEAEFAPQIKSMEEGDEVDGILEGYGPDTEFTQKNPSTGKDETRTVHTWILKALGSNARVSILSSVQLDSKLPPFIGDRVQICRGRDVKTRQGFKVADYMVKGPPVKGKVRTWARQSLPQPVIDVTPALAGGDQPSLPAGGEDASA